MAAQQQKENYQRVLDQTIEQLTKEGKVPMLLLHSCCAPCSSYVLEYLSKYFKITLLYYNPNISLKEEYEARVREQKRLIGKWTLFIRYSSWKENICRRSFTGQ